MSRIDGLPGNAVARPAGAVLEFDVNELPVDSLVQDLVSISTIANLWSGWRYLSAAKRWCQASSIDNDIIYLPYKDLGNFTFTGSAEVIGRLVDRIMTNGGIAQRYAEFFSDEILENLACKEGESTEECVERIIANHL